MYKLFFEDRYITLGESMGSPGEEGENVITFKSRKQVAGLVEDFACDSNRTHLHLVHTDMEELRSALRSCFRLIEAGGGLVFNKAGAFLAIERNGMWDLPKGKLDHGEDFETAALREVGEETGLKGVENLQLISSTYHTYSLKGTRILKETRWFEMRYTLKKKPVLQSEEGITDYRWVPPLQMDFILDRTYASIRDLLNLRFPPGTA